MTFFEKSQVTLELPQVLRDAAAEAQSDAGKAAILSLAPVTDKYEITRRQSETSAAKHLLSLRGSPSFAGVKDVSSSLARADIGGMLNTRELLDIAGLLKAARNVKGYFTDEGNVHTCIDYLFAGIQTNRFLEEKIYTSIAAEDEISDSASNELATVRRLIRAANARIRESLQKIISSPAYSKILQEPIITMRSDRYVVPVKAEHKSSLQGLVHDVSSSGATVFIEPISVVNANNEIKELKSREKQEIERILMELSAEAAAHKDDILSDFSVLAALDTVFAKAQYSYKLNASEPQISEGGRIILKRARHPLLPKNMAVPIDVHLGDDFDTLVITGPNTGGKTVTLKTIGLLSIMTQCGLHIPVSDGSEVPIFDKVLADIGDEQSIEQSLSTFSSHMTNIVSILDECDRDTLLLFDELGAGTDPTEGAALAISVIEYARALGAKIAATTHYAELKIYATTTEGVHNASCEFDVTTLRPTYRLLIGIPGKSNAFAISSRLGLPDIIIEDAKKRIDSGTASFEDVLEQLEKSRQEMERENLETQKLLHEAELREKKAEEYLDESMKEREKAAETARREAAEILEDARRTAEQVFAELSEIRKQKNKNDDWQRINEAKSELRRKLNEGEAKLGAERIVRAAAEKPSRPIKAGDTVEILKIGTRAKVISINPDGSMELQAGIMKISAKPEEVSLREDETKNDVKQYMKRAEAKLRSLSVKPEIDLRGMMTDEAVSVMERFIDSAVMAKLNTVTIIHGKGTGALRAAVQAELKRNRMVKSFRLGHYGEGESGVTIVELK